MCESKFKSAKPANLENTQFSSFVLHRIRLFEVSALDRNSLYEPFVYLSSKLNPPQNKSTFSQLTMGRRQQTKES